MLLVTSDVVLAVAPADPHLEASCRYARQADERDYDRFVEKTEARMVILEQMDEMLSGFRRMNDSFVSVVRQLDYIRLELSISINVPVPPEHVVQPPPMYDQAP